MAMAAVIGIGAGILGLLVGSMLNKKEETKQNFVANDNQPQPQAQNPNQDLINQQGAYQDGMQDARIQQLEAQVQMLTQQIAQMRGCGSASFGASTPYQGGGAALLAVAGSFGGGRTF